MKSVIITALMVLMGALGASAQNNVRPYVEAGITINGGGYVAVAPLGTAGADAEFKHFVSIDNVTYDFSHKANDGEPGNTKGHVVKGSSSAYLKLGNWLYGGGLFWGKTITEDYTKEATYPYAGVGRDFRKFRLLVSYEQEVNEITHYPNLVTFTGKGEKFGYRSYTCKCNSGVKGFDTQLWIPLRPHLSFHADLVVYRFHTALTDPNYMYLTNLQMKEHDISGGLNYTMLWRF